MPSPLLLALAPVDCSDPDRSAHSRTVEYALHETLDFGCRFGRQLKTVGLESSWRPCCGDSPAVARAVPRLVAHANFFPPLEPSGREEDQRQFELSLAVEIADLELCLVGMLSEIAPGLMAPELPIWSLVANALPVPDLWPELQSS